MEWLKYSYDQIACTLFSYKIIENCDLRALHRLVCELWNTYEYMYNRSINYLVHHQSTHFIWYFTSGGLLTFWRISLMYDFMNVYWNLTIREIFIWRGSVLIHPVIMLLCYDKSLYSCLSFVFVCFNLSICPFAFFCYIFVWFF